MQLSCDNTCIHTCASWAESCCPYAWTKTVFPTFPRLGQSELSHFEIISSEGLSQAQPTFAQAAWNNVFSPGIPFVSRDTRGRLLDSHGLHRGWNLSSETGCTALFRAGEQMGWGLCCMDSDATCSLSLLTLIKTIFWNKTIFNSWTQNCTWEISSCW